MEPMVIGMIGMPTSTILSRCHVISLQRKLPNEKADEINPQDRIYARTLPNYAGPAAVHVTNDYALVDTVIGGYIYVDTLEINFVNPSVVSVKQAGTNDVVDIVGYGFHPDIYDLLNEIEGVENYIVEVSTNEIGTDDILIRVGAQIVTDKFEKSIKDHFRAKLRVAPNIQFEIPAQILKEQFPEMSRKPITFVDKR